MAPRYTVFADNPIELRTRKAMRVIGKLIEEWSINPDSHPEGARTELDGRLIVFSRGVFQKTLQALPEIDRLGDEDYILRDNIAEIELMLRRPDRFSILLPEPEAIAFQQNAVQQGLWPTVSLPMFYAEVPWDEGGDGWMPHVASPDSRDDAPAGYAVQLSGENPLDEFLRPYLAGYCCTQCS
ncbi:hypothetical protein [Microbulbifer sp. S227A]|uniref:hypothetical protein n=1 Tax=Microbulbifer sp. S227A TaxID=3415131 RepID=UPI003C7CD803